MSINPQLSTETPSVAHPSRRYKRNISFFWPIVLIGLGVIILLSNTGVLQGDVWDWVLRLWPVILIAWGLDGLLRRELVWPVFLISVGVIFLLANFGRLTIGSWDVILQLWPLLLVIGGLSLVFDRRSLLISVIGAVLVFGILTAAAWYVGMRADTTATIMPAGQSILQETGGATQANITIEPVAGSVHIVAMTGSANLVEGTVVPTDRETVVRSFTLNGSTANYRLGSSDVFVGPWPTTDDRNWDLKLNADIPMVLHVSLAAGKIDLNLVGLKITNLKVANAFGSATVTLPAEGKFSATVNNVVGSTTIVVPEGVGVRAHVNAGVASTNMPSGYQHSGSVYTSPNYEGALSQVDLQVNHLLGSLTIRTLSTGR